MQKAHLKNSHKSPHARSNRAHHARGYNHDLYAKFGKIKNKTNALLGKSLKTATAKTAATKNAMGHFIVKKPYQSLGIVLIGAFLCGLFFRR